MKAVVVPRGQGERAVRDLLARGVVLRDRRILPADGELFIPILDCAEEEATALGYRVEEMPDSTVRERQAVPFDTIRRKAGLPDELASLLPDKWEMLGDVLVLRFPAELSHEERRLAGIYAGVLGMRAVVAERGVVEGEFREPKADLVLGDSSEARHLENGVRYWLDPRKVMFSSGNIKERVRMARLPIRGQVVADMFAGIGYFTLPMALHGGATVHAFEKNPVAFAYLERNIVENELVGRVHPFLMDNRDAPEGFADRVVMGYMGGTASFLPKALRMLKGKGIVHYHDGFFEGDLWEKPMTEIEKAVSVEGGSWRLLEKRVVKSYARRRNHIVVDFEYAR